MKKASVVLVSFFLCAWAEGQTVSVIDTIYTTYPFFDPDPVPRKSHIYPYSRYDGFTFQPERKSWKNIILENEYLRVRIFPEIGGKIWSVKDKKTGKELFYDNDVVKFRDISLRGPWTSGGIEFNYGIIGHAPSCSFPVDYEIRQLDNGSVSCYIGVLDLLTRTRWTVEINLPRDKGWVRTHSFWHNGSGLPQPYYSWANAGVEATDSLRILYPGEYSVAHSGQIDGYPILQGRDVSWWKNQAFGVDKSFHPAGSHKNFFAAYWVDADYGMMHFAPRDEKVGRKFFSWALSDQGDIWRELLTDTKPQYVELQSGRLFNQNLLESVHTPFKQPVFAPFGADEWSEYWFPFSGTGGADYVSLSGVASVITEEEAFTFMFSSLLDDSGVLEIRDDAGNVLASRQAELETAKSYKAVFMLPEGKRPTGAFLNGKKLWSADKQLVDRPNAIPVEYDRNSIDGLMQFARYASGMRQFALSEEYVNRILLQDRNHVSALVLKSELCLRKALWQEAYDYANRALSVDGYEPEANYLSGIAALELGKPWDAKDRFEIASISSDLRSAAHTQLCRIYFSEKDFQTSLEYARKSLITNAWNVAGIQMLYLCLENLGEPEAKTVLQSLEDLDPLCHFPDFERFIAGKLTSEELKTTIQEEFRWQEYMEQAILYARLGLFRRSLKILEACPDQNALVKLWTAWLKQDPARIRDAESAELDRVFPFRTESLEPLRWAVHNGGGWQSRYLLSALENFLGNAKTALDVIKGVNESRHAPFYAYRASLASSESDLKKAAELDPEQWRYVGALAKHYLNAEDLDLARKVLEPYYQAHPDNFHVGDLYLKTLIAQNEYGKAEKVIRRIRILPFEGQSGSRVMYRDIKLHLAATAIDRGRYNEALRKLEESRLWPDNLGVGKPYDELVDARMEDFLTAVTLLRKGEREKAMTGLSMLCERDPGGGWRDVFNKVCEKHAGVWPKVSGLLEKLNASNDKRLF